MRLIFALPAIFLLSLQAPLQAAESQEPAPLSAGDKAFLKDTIRDNHSEIETCLAAENKAVHPAVKAFTRLMLEDHVQIARRLAAFLNAEGIQPPDNLGDQGQKSLSEIKGVSGNGFDQEFMAQQIQAHKQDLQRLKQIEDTAKSPKLKQLAMETYSILKEHLALAEAVENALKDTSRKASR